MSVVTEGLTREQIKAFRNADSAVLRWHTDGYNHPGTITLGKEVERGDGFGRETLRVEIDAPAIVHNYGGHDDSEAPNTTLPRAIKGSWVLLCLSVSTEWHTIAQLLRPGDQLVQEWAVDNRNILLRRAGLTAHEIKLEVRRPKDGQHFKRFAFMLDAGVRDPWNTASEVTRG